MNNSWANDDYEEYDQEDTIPIICPKCNEIDWFEIA